MARNCYTWSPKKVKATPELYLRLGKSLEGLGEVDKAIGKYSKAIKLDPEYVDGYRCRADLLAEGGPEYADDAARDYQILSRISDGSPVMFYMEIAKMYGKYGRWAEVIHYCEKVVLSKKADKSMKEEAEGLKEDAEIKKARGE